MRPLKLACAVVAMGWMGLAALPAQADGNPAITSIAIDSQASWWSACWSWWPGWLLLAAARQAAEPALRSAR